MREEQPQIATLIHKIADFSQLSNPNVVKVVRDNKGYALYFSRSSIPFLRNMPVTKHTFYQHVGIYGFNKATLQAVSALSPTSLELAESLEQLRWLENGFSILTVITDYQSIAIDTPTDLERANALP